MTGLVRYVTLTGSVVALSIWGGAYFYDCANYLLSPGVPVSFEYQTPTGTVKLTATSYAIDPWQGSAVIRNPKIQEPLGGQVAEASRVTISNFHSIWQGDGSTRIRVSDLDARLLRFPNGHFEFERLIPKSEGPPSNNAFDIEVDRAKIALLDNSKQGMWQQAANTSKLRISVVGDDWMADGELSIPGVGTASTKVQGSPQLGVIVKANTTGLHLASAAHHFLEISPDKRLAKASFTDLYAKGPIQLFIPPKGALQISTEGQFEAKGLRYEQYQADHATFTGAINQDGIQGKVQAWQGQNLAIFDGGANWKSKLVLAGNINAQAANSSSIPQWISKFIPKDVGFQGASYQGWVSYQEGANPITRGSLKIDQARYQKESARNISTTISAAPDEVVVNLNNATYQNLPASGIIRLQPNTKRIDGLLTAQGVSLGNLADRFKFKGVKGNASVTARLEGTYDKPVAQLVARGTGSYQWKPGRTIEADQFEFTGTVAKKGVTVNRGWLSSPAGLIAITGTANPDGTFEMHVDGRALTPSSLFPELLGTVNARATITGTSAHPVAKGRVEGYDLAFRGEEAPASTLDFYADRDHVAVNNINVVRGTSQLTGSAELKLKDKHLSGFLAATDIQITELLGDQFSGVLNAPLIELSGTISDPKLVAQIEGNSLVGRGVKVDGLTGRISLDQTLAQASADMIVANGKLHANGAYSLSYGEGSGSFNGKDLSLDKLTADVQESALIEGITSLNGTIAYKNGKVNVDANGRLDTVHLNDTPLGDGNWTAGFDGTHARGNLSIGTLLPELRVADLRVEYDLASKWIRASTETNRFDIQTLVLAAEPYLRHTSSDIHRKIAATQGDLDLSASISGPLHNPIINVEMLEASKIAVQGTSYGTLSLANLVRKSGYWRVPSAQIKGPAGNVEVSGLFAEQGDIEMSAKGTNIQLNALAPFAEGLRANKGLLSFDFAATGSALAPSVKGSFEASNLLKTPEIEGVKFTEEDALRIDKTTVQLSEKDGLQIDGTYRYAGFGGALTAKSGFNYKTAFKEQDIDATLTLNERKLSELPMVQSYLDPTRTSGKLLGKITAQGKAENLTIEGGVDLIAEKLGVKLPDGAVIKKVDDTLSDVAVHLGLSPESKLVATASAKVDRGGSMLFDLSTTQKLALESETGVKLSADSLLAMGLTGSFQTNGAVFRQALEGGYVQGKATSIIDIAGTVRRPDISGVVKLSNVESSVPSIGGGDSSSAPPIIDPRFKIDFAFDNPAKVRSSTAEFQLEGYGNILGSLSSPEAYASLTVDRGSIRLPSALVRVDRGGTLDFSFRSTTGTQPAAKLEVDLQGRTSVVTTQFGEGTKRYGILLAISGDLLDQKGLKLDATADPPDLSNDQVMGLLGQKDLLESLGSQSNGQTGVESRLRSALAGYALPTVLDPITSNIARGFGLDYLSIEYNAIDQTTISYAKTLGSEFSIQGRQQVGTPSTGYKPVYDIRLVYSPRASSRLPGVFKRINYSIGVDQDRPFKFSMEYQTRFGGPKQDSGPKKKIVISP